MLSSLQVLTLLGLIVAGGEKPAVKTPLVDVAELQRAGFQVYWEAQLPLVEGDSTKEGYLVDGALYVTTTGGSIFALQRDMGLLRWGTKLTEPGYWIFAPAHLLTPDGNGLVVIPTSRATFSTTKG